MRQTPINKQAITFLILIFSNLWCFSQQNTFPYKLNYSDIGIIGVGASSLVLGKYIENQQSKITLDELIALDAKQINSFDKSATENWNSNLDDLSEVMKYTLVAAPSILVLATSKNKQWKNSLSYATMYFETALLTYGITELTKATTKRIRPSLYNANLSITDKEQIIEDDNVYDSFFSGSTSISFASAVFLSKTYTDIYGKSIWSKVIWGTSLTLASTAGYLRYESGNHFPTDIITGAIVGSAIGYLIPALHKTHSKNDDLSFFLSTNGFYITYRL